jgi:basic membrane lipoprotein Med (substrate-binding protein (PBP1-ABC) superfamily)
MSTAVKKLTRILSVALGAIVLLAGCSKPAGDTATQVKKLKIAGCYNTPLEEPWPNCIHQACTKVAEEENCEYKYSDNIGQTNFERILRQYCEQGFDVITGDAFGNEETVRRVAKEYPSIAFCFGSGLGLVEPNFAVFDNWIHQPAYLCGIIAGRITKTNVIGCVAQMDIPEVNRIANAYIDGAKSVNPKVKVLGSYVGSFFDPPKTKEAALAQIEAKADVLFSMGYGGIDAAKERGILAFGNMQDQAQLAPEHVITGPIWNMYPTIKAVIKSVKSDNFTAMDYKDFSMMPKGGSYLAPYRKFAEAGFAKALPKDVIDEVDGIKEKIMQGQLRLTIKEGTASFDNLKK